VNKEYLFFFGFGVLHGVRDEFTDDVSETAVGPIFTGFRNIFNTSHIVEKPQNQKNNIYSTLKV
jgi:hypothetical protein